MENKLGSETMLQKHIRLGRVNVNYVVTINVIIALILLFLTTLGIVEILPDSYRWVGGVWFVWGFFGSIVSEKIKPKYIQDLVLSLPAHACTKVAAYIISSIYWVVAKIFTRE